MYSSLFSASQSFFVILLLKVTLKRSGAATLLMSVEVACWSGVRQHSLLLDRRVAHDDDTKEPVKLHYGLHLGNHMS